MKPSAGCHFPAIWLRGEWPKSSLKDLLFEKAEGSVIKFNRSKNTISIEPSLKPGVNTTQVKQPHPLIHRKDVAVIYDVKAVWFMEGCRKLGKEAIGTDPN